MLAFLSVIIYNITVRVKNSDNCKACSLQLSHNNRKGFTKMKNIHIISHSHWDREWYMPFEHHRARLIDLIDVCMKMLETDADFKSFHLDGHTIELEDYLEIKPQNKDKLKKFVKDGKIKVGPWYVLQDEFFTSSEANIRNLLVGMKIAKDFGKVNMIGYFPDSFGNAGQMPQILKQAGMKAIVFGRGVKPTGAANVVSDFSDYKSQYSEMYWESPDGSSLPAVLFANWYNNGEEIPADGNKEYWDKRIENVLKYASTDELLFMNGSDHMPVQPDLPEAIRASRKNYPEYNFIHSNFEDYIDAMIPELPKDLTVIKGELISQDTDGLCTLVNTSSSHANLKRMNRESETMLESLAEPISVMARFAGCEYPHDMIEYSWKTLMKNHPHDSICGCSVDEVNDEMRTRFLKSMQAAETVIDKGLKAIADSIDASKAAGDTCFAVVNTFGRDNTDVVSVDVDTKRIYGSDKLTESAKEINSNLTPDEYILVDENNEKIDAEIEYLGSRFGYDLPDDKFRRPYMAETYRVTFEAENVPAMGYKVYSLVKGKSQNGSLVCGNNEMENAALHVSLNDNGTINIKDKKTGRIFKELLKYEDVGDVGNEYIFVQPNNTKPIISGDKKAKIELVYNKAYKAEYKITTEMEIPKSADEQLQKEIRNFVNIRDRKAQRSSEFVKITIYTYVSLEKNAKSVKIRTEFENTAKDHRLRVLIPTGLTCTEHRVESVFEAATRSNKHKSTWINPSGCEHQQGFVMMKDDAEGVLVANKGMYEYEILEDNTIALTLVRATGEMGDWGVFPTEMSQCLRKLIFDYEIVPFSDESEALEIAAAMQYPMQCVQIIGKSGNGMDNKLIDWNGNMLRMTAFKTAQDGDDIIMRWVNYSEESRILTVKKTKAITNLYKSDVIETNNGVIEENNGEWKIEVKPYEILTLGSVTK